MKNIVIGLFVACLSQQAEAIKLTSAGGPPAYKDGFMDKVYGEYSTLEKGIHKITKAKAKELCFKALTLDAGMKDGAANGVIGDHFEKVWAHYDVNAVD